MSTSAKREEDVLASLGYAQTLKRSISPFGNFATSFSIVSVITGINQLYSYGLSTGGPVALIWGWFIVASFTMCVALSMGEICSAFPTTGGMYYSAAALAPKNGKGWAWFCGWFNILGQFAITASIGLGFSYFTAAFFQITADLVVTPAIVVGINALVLIIGGLINTFTVGALNVMGVLSVIWHILGTIIIFIILLARAPKFQPASFVFGEFLNMTGWENSGYVFLLGLLVAQWTFTGYDASAHMSEETQKASTAGPRGILFTIIVSFFCGLMLLLSMTFSIQNVDSIFNSTTGQPVAQLYLDTAGVGWGSVLIFIVMGAMFFCCVASITANSRMIYAFSRDGALPGHQWWSFLPKSKIPVPAVWLAVTVAFILGLPSLGGVTAQAAVTSIATIGLYISYGIPIFLRLLQGKNFNNGPFHLGKFSDVINTVACLWIAFITILFVLPPIFPVNGNNFNYAVVAVGTVVIVSGGWWIISARKWFKGPKNLRKSVDGDDEKNKNSDDEINRNSDDEINKNSDEL